MRIEGEKDLRLLEEVGLTEAQIDDMYRYMALANYEDRFVIPTGQEETRLEDPAAFQGINGFSLGNSEGDVSDFGLFPKQRTHSVFVDLPKP
jgi:nitrate reductase beta subunit